MAVLEVKNITKIYKNNRGDNLKVLDSLSLKVEKSEFVSLIGPSASGKSTLLDCISGLADYDSGQISSPQTAYMMQDDVLLPWRTLRQNVSLPLEIKGFKTPQINKKIKSLSEVFGLSRFLEYYPSGLSGGMKQRASLLRAYVQDKSLLLLDEPFGKLDALLKIKLIEWFLDIWQRQKQAVLMVTHDIDEAIFLSDVVYVMSRDKGNIVFKIKVPFARPRKNELLISAEFSQVRKRLFKYFL